MFGMWHEEWHADVFAGVLWLVKVAAFLGAVGGIWYALEVAL